LTYYTYAYLREDGSPYYIGKGSGRRMYQNNGRCCARPTDKSRILKLKEFDTEEEAFEHECYLIGVYGKKCEGTGILYNVSDGGEGITGNSHHMKTDYYRKLVSEKLKGKPTNRPPGNKGIPLTKEHKERISGEGNGKSKRWRITFLDGNVIELVGISNWCKKNGYYKGHVSSLVTNKDGRMKHKDIVKVEIIG